MKTDKRECKVALCKQCSGWNLLADMPWAETDRSCRTDYARAAANGQPIKILPVAEAHELGMCKGHTAAQMNLFTA
ncbi:hypothetical protein [Hymenobacter siberiensis]|uniref:hypothetical protein n=1 Tax=Hymenobacter siberiensis TaxID=2848396 RepID=UPI001C1E3A50|nr:hypothetical protein [Hymenobacter siberiensis]